ncbi:aldolase [Paxillus ammoniavirescens]|nr:aldolase [Paxillus ammoniavirescens]
MPSAEPAPAVPFVPRRFASGRFPVSRSYNLEQMLYNYSVATNSDDSGAAPSEKIIPAFPFNDVPIYADSVDLETLGFHDFWGCLLTPDNIASRIHTDDLRYHVWVATKRVVESDIIELNRREWLVEAVMSQFMVELTLALLDRCPGPVVLFIDPRLHNDAEGMVARAYSLVSLFDEANVRRWRVIITLPATEDGLRAAYELTNEHGIQTNLSLVSCLPHASACIETGTRMMSMSVEPIMEWFEQQDNLASRVASISPDHPGIETVQSCASYIRRHGLNTTLVTTDVRKFAELKQLSGIGGAALNKNQLDQIPKRKLTTWYPRPDDKSPATIHALQAAYPSKYLDRKKGFLVSLPAECRSLVSAVLYVRLGKMKVHMETIEAVVRAEVKRRVDLETIPLDALYRLPSEARTLRKSKSTKTLSSKRSKSSVRRSSRQEKPPHEKEIAPMVEGVDYF